MVPRDSGLVFESCRTEVEKPIILEENWSLGHPSYRPPRDLLVASPYVQQFLQQNEGLNHFGHRRASVSPLVRVNR